MRIKKKVSAAHFNGLNIWGGVIQDELGFADANVTVPAGGEPDMFIGSMKIDEFRNGGLKINVNSSAQRVTLLHEDGVKNKQNKFILLNSCGSLLIRNSEHRKIISYGDGIILPAWEKYTEECFSGRNSLSFIFDISFISESADALSSMLWRNISDFNFGFEINRVISNFYCNYSERFCEKNVQTLLGLLSLEAEMSEVNMKKIINNTSKTPNEKYSLIISFIRNNIKNPDLCLSSLAEYLGITERMIQYILAEEKVTFFNILTTERCKLLANKIRYDINRDMNIYIYESGFRSISTANRQFKTIYGVTPKQYQKQLINSRNIICAE
ncbi:helix-turn-helix transcriptional regulator [Salmonella enterica]|nr:helix-turn-helix transcriptional regulator [Salmonella enterica]